MLIDLKLLKADSKHVKRKAYGLDSMEGLQPEQRGEAWTLRGWPVSQPFSCPNGGCPSGSL